MARAPYLRHSGHLNQPPPSSTISREAEKDRIPTGAPTHVPGAPNPSLKGTLVSCCCSLTRLHSEAWKNSARTNPAQQIRGVSPRLRSWPGHLTSPHRRSRAKARLSNKSCCPGHCPDEVMSSFQGLGGLAAEKLVEVGALQVPRQFYFFSSKTVPVVGAYSF